MKKTKDYLITIKPRSGWIAINFRELWEYRQLFYIFTWRDIKIRYKQTVIGIGWAILQPFLLMVVFSIFFGKLGKIPSGDIPYPIFVFSGLIYWQYFSTALGSASNSLVINENILKKIYFPRLILPFSSSITPIIDMLIAFAVLIGMMIYYNFALTVITILLLPVLILISFLAAAGFGTFLAAINIKYRDIRYALPFFIQLLMFLTPVIYPSTFVEEKYRWILALNPMTGVIEAARSSITGTAPVDLNLLAISGATSITFFLFGILYFRKSEKIFADVA